MVAKSVEVQIGVSGDAEAKLKLDQISLKADELRKSFPAYAVKIDAAAATQKLAVFRAQLKTVADAAAKPIDVQVLSAKAAKTLEDIRLRADKLKATFPDFTVRIDDAKAKAELALFAAEARVTLDKVQKEFDSAGSGGFGSKILGLIPGVGGGGAGASGAAGGAGSAASAASSGGSVLANPYVLTGAVAAGLLALPFAAQAAAGGITFALGGALAGIAILGASKSKSVQDSFATLKTHATADLTTIGTSFVPVVNSILGTAGKLLTTLTPVFSKAAGTIAGPFKTFADTLIKAFGQPAVQQSIQAVATAFGKILTAATPGLATAVGQIASGVTKLANAVAANPKAFTDFIGFLAATAGGVLTAIASLTRFASYIEAHFIPVFDGARHEISHVWADIASNTNDVWKRIWADTIGKAIQGGHAVETAFNTLKAGTILAVNTLKSSLSTTWNTIWANTVTRVQNGIADTVRFFTGLPGKVLAALGSAGKVLTSWGSGVITGLLAGMTSVIGDVWNFIKGIPGKILGFLGIHSPPQWAIDAGKHIMNGLGIGMSQAQGALKNASNAAQSAVAAGTAGAGVQQWKPTVLQALKLLGLSAGLSGDVLYQMQTESGGNATIVNKTDSNWLAGHPSVGLMQVIAGTFAQYAGPYRNTGPFEYGVSVNPLANIYAALNYAAHNAGFGSGAGQIGSGHGYAFGTSSALPGWAMVGERGPEMVRFRGGEQVIPSGGTGGGGSDDLGAKLDRLAAKLDQLIGVTAAVPARTGQHVGAAIGGAAHDASFRSRYH